MAKKTIERRVYTLEYLQSLLIGGLIGTILAFAINSWEQDSRLDAIEEVLGIEQPEGGR